MLLAALAAAVTLTACGGRGSSAVPPIASIVGAQGAARSAGGARPQPTAPPDAPGHSNVIPPAPAGGTSRAGAVYSVYLTASTGDTVAFTVFEPSTITGGATYPLVLHGHGWSGSRTKTLGSPAASPSEGVGVGTNLSELVYNGYGVISFDQRGFGENTGMVDSMNPDKDAADILAVMDWAQAKLPWLAYAPTLDGRDPHEPVMGAIGGSYGGMYQYLILNTDQRRRLRAIVPNIAPSDLNYALVPGGVFKSLWNDFLWGAGLGTAQQRLDPFITTQFVATDNSLNNTESAYSHDYYAYHSADYFCDGTSVATNGGPGTAPLLPPATVTPKVNAMIWIGIRDTLFDFNNGYNNYACLRRAGGDVRLLSYQAGHNSLGMVPDTGATLYYPSGDSNDSRCGSTLSEAQAQLMWFDRYLKGKANAASAIPANPCISLSMGDAITLATVPTMTSGLPLSAFDVGSLAVVAGANVDVPAAVGLYTAGAGGTVVAGIPHVTFQVSAVGGIAAGTPMVFVGVGQMHASNPGVWDLVDNQLTPLRGQGQFDVDLAGVGVRLAPRDQLGILVFGLQDQYARNGTASAAKPAVVPVTVTGTARLPILSQAPPPI
ncbi:MAG TPA: CocE/NonD family hydrolase [Candidatus Elarobacter sp.]